MYTDLVKNIEKFTIETPSTIIPQPSLGDYENGFIERFFMRVSFDNTGFVYEVDQRTYEKYRTNPFWVVERMYWRLTGPLNAVYDIIGNVVDKGVVGSNKASISMASLKIKNISLYLPNLLQFRK